MPAVASYDAGMRLVLTILSFVLLALPFASHASGGCYDGGMYRPEGSQATCVTHADGAQQCIADGVFVCRSGRWVVQSTMPGPGTIAVCPMLYAPVCGAYYSPVYKEETFSNRCFLAQSGATYLYDGPCRPVNQPPIITHFQGPLTATTGEPTSWELTVTDQKSNQLTIIIYWGDGTQTTKAVTATGAAQTLAVTHTYTYPGTYTAMVLVQDAQGFNSSRYWTVTVTRAEPAPPPSPPYPVYPWTWDWGWSWYWWYPGDWEQWDWWGWWY